MHDAAYAFVARTVAALELNRAEHAVVELGAFNVNGSVRLLFDCCGDYVGVDRRDGPGVDVVCDAAAYLCPDAVDVVVTTEMLEHAPNAEVVLANAYTLLAPGGWLVLTAAGAGRGAHGNDGGALGDGEFYRNVGASELEAWLTAAGFGEIEITVNERDGDIYATARR